MACPTISSPTHMGRRSQSNNRAHSASRKLRSSSTLSSRPLGPRGLFKGDCLWILSKLPDNSVDAVVTDPPYYGDGQLGNTWAQGMVTTNSTVRNIPSGMAFDSQQGRQLTQFLRPVADELLRVVKPGGLGAVFASPRLAHATASAFEEAGWWIRDQWVWHYPASQPRAARLTRFASSSCPPERLAQMNDWKTPQATPAWESIVLVQAPPAGTLTANWEQYGCGLLNCSGVTPTTVLGYLKPDSQERAMSGSHPTPKPVALCRDLVRRLCPPGGVVVDPFLGSGTTAVAAQRENREWIGCELSNEYWPTIESRVAVG